MVRSVLFVPTATSADIFDATFRLSRLSTIGDGWYRVRGGAVAIPSAYIPHVSLESARGESCTERQGAALAVLRAAATELCGLKKHGDKAGTTVRAAANEGAQVGCGEMGPEPSITDRRRTCSVTGPFALASGGPPNAARPISEACRMQQHVSAPSVALGALPSTSGACVVPKLSSNDGGRPWSGRFGGG